jgi:hypothetical protein
MPIAPFRYPAFASMFTGLVSSRIQSRHGNDFAGTFMLIDVATHLNEKIGGAFIQPDGGEGLARRKGVIVRWRLKEAWSKTVT